ncbi:integral membrane protein [Rutstroemia sp. NJR-2017a BBW]|nr:integral membrane protein [Rutstroemia sp. NJR-2017a BBW]
MPNPDPNLPHDSKANQILGVCSAMLVLITVVVAARIWIRLKYAKGGLGSDDYCIIVAWVLGAAFDLDPINPWSTPSSNDHMLTDLTEVKFGLGQHIYDLPESTNFSASLELYYFGELLYYICVSVTKLAILFLYLRLATSKTFRRIVWGVMAFVIATGLSSCLAGIFQCTPIDRAWDVQKLGKGHCINVNGLFYANAGLDIFQDLVIYILPMNMLYHIQIPKRQKYALMLVFAVGGFVVITGAIRLYYLQGAQASDDPSYDNTGGAIWSSIESNIGIVCASLPHFKPLIDRFLPSLMGRTRGGSKVKGNSAPSNSNLAQGNYIKQRHDAEYELERGGVPKWKDTYNGKYEENLVNNIEGGETTYSAHDSEEHLRGAENHLEGDGIYKSTKIVVSRLPAA